MLETIFATEKLFVNRSEIIHTQNKVTNILYESKT